MSKYIINIVTVLLSLFSIYSSLIYVLYLIANMLGISYILIYIRIEYWNYCSIEVTFCCWLIRDRQYYMNDINM